MISQADEARLARLIRAALREELDARAASSAAHPTELRPLLSIGEVATRLGVSVSKVREYVREGRLRSIQLGGKNSAHRFDPLDVDAVLEAAKGWRR